jgi:hypothetical protein
MIDAYFLAYAGLIWVLTQTFKTVLDKYVEERWRKTLTLALALVLSYLVGRYTQKDFFLLFASVVSAHEIVFTGITGGAEPFRSGK